VLALVPSTVQHLVNGKDENCSTAADKREVIQAPSETNTEFSKSVLRKYISVLLFRFHPSKKVERVM
jgi:hypothetical protein